MSNKTRPIGWALLLLALGVILLLDNFDVIDFGDFVFKLWPLLLIWWGYMLLRKRTRHEEGHSTIFGDRTGTTTSSEIDQSTVFGDVMIRVKSTEFTGGTVKTVFGNLSIDLGGVESITAPASLELHCVFGNIFLHVPERIGFEITGATAFGNTTMPDGTTRKGNTFQSSGFDTAEQRLSINVHQGFGNIEVMR